FHELTAQPIVRNAAWQEVCISAHVRCSCPFRDVGDARGLQGDAPDIPSVISSSNRANQASQADLPP
ncbi:MAG: hypothetical protein Q9172_006874, partial [Xanthocarpia lactea]